jgi:hypothetical protein
LKDKLIKIGAKVVSHGRYVAFQMAEVAIPRQRLPTRQHSRPRVLPEGRKSANITRQFGSDLGEGRLHEFPSVPCLLELEEAAKTAGLAAAYTAV